MPSMHTISINKDFTSATARYIAERGSTIPNHSHMFAIERASASSKDFTLRHMGLAPSQNKVCAFSCCKTAAKEISAKLSK